MSIYLYHNSKTCSNRRDLMVFQSLPYVLFALETGPGRMRSHSLWAQIRARTGRGLVVTDFLNIKDANSPWVLRGLKEKLRGDDIIIGTNRNNLRKGCAVRLNTSISTVLGLQLEFKLVSACLPPYDTRITEFPSRHSVAACIPLIVATSHSVGNGDPRARQRESVCQRAE